MMEHGCARFICNRRSRDVARRERQSFAKERAKRHRLQGVHHDRLSVSSHKDNFFMVIICVDNLVAWFFRDCRKIRRDADGPGSTL